MPFLEGQDNCVLQLIYYLIQTSDISPGHLEESKVGKSGWINI